jgi:tripartite-type tricarboxylate transporter receptor subunit TctC
VNPFRHRLPARRLRARGAFLPVALAVAVLSVLGAGDALAQAWAVKPVRMIVPFPAAGATDIAARQVSQRLSDAWGQPVVIENRPGAGGTLGTEVAARAPADGYTLMTGSVSTHTIAPHLYLKLAYDPLKDFVPITEVATTPNVLVVNNALPVRNLRELVALARKRPNELTYGSNGSGANNHLAGELLQAGSGIRLQHVPYKGSAFATNDLLGGHISFMFDTLLTALPHVKSGKVRAIALAGPRRSPSLPDIPTAAEQGFPDLEVMVWLGMWAPAGVPPEVVKRTNADAVAALRTPKLQEFFASQGAEAVGSTPAQFAAHVRTEHARWKKVIETAKVQLD